MKRHISLAIVAVLFFAGLAWAHPVNKTEAEKAVKGWLKADATPMNMSLGGQINKVDTYNGAGWPARLPYCLPETIGFCDSCRR